MKNTLKLTKPTTADQELIYDLFVEGVNLNVYQKKLTEDLNYLQTMANHMATMPYSIDFNTNRYINNYMCTLNDKHIGFITTAHDYTKNEFEIWYFSISKKYQKQGFGNKYFKLVLDMIEDSKENASVLVRTKNSEAMVSILKQHDFKVVSTNKQGFSNFYKN